MGLADMFNIKKKLEMLNEGSEESGADLVQVDDGSEGESSSAIFDRLAMPLPRLVAPDGATHQETYYKVGDEYTRTLFIHNYPPQVVDNWLRDILRFRHAVDVAIYIQPLDIKKFLDQMRQRLARDEAAVAEQERQGELIDARRVRRYQDYKQFIEAVQNDITKPFQIMVAMTLRAQSEAELDKITEEFERKLTSVQVRRARFRHKQGFESTLPLMQNNLYDLQAIRPMHTQGLMAMFPFSSAELTHESGVLVAISQQTGSPIILNRFMQPHVKSPNTAILGATGSGKSYFAKVEMLRWNYLGVPAIVLDPSGEYRPVCEGVGGANIQISLDSEQVINPLDFSNAVRPGHNPLREKIAFMIDMLGVMVRSQDSGGVIYDAVTKQIVDNALQEVYRVYGYRMDQPESQMGATPEHMPRLSEVHNMLQRIAKVNNDGMVQDRIQPLIAALGTYVNDGALAPLFDQHTTVDMHSHFINFDYSSLPRQYLSLAMHLVLEYLRTSFFTREQQESGQNRLLYIDEAQILMQERETALFLEYTARTCRKYGIGLTVMTQDVGVFALNEDGSENKIGRGILNACTIKALLKQEPSEAEAIKRAFNVTQSELSQLLSAGTGEGLLYVGRETAWFTSVGLTSEAEHRMLTTTPDELRQIVAEQREAQQLHQPRQQVIDESHQLRGGVPQPQAPLSPPSPYGPYGPPQGSAQQAQLPAGQHTAQSQAPAPVQPQAPQIQPAVQPQAPQAQSPAQPAQPAPHAPQTQPPPQPAQPPAAPRPEDDPFGA